MGENHETKAFIVVRPRRVRQYVAQAVSGFGLILATIGTGALLGSSAMQWVGFILLCLYALSVMYAKDKRYTLSEAKRLLDAIEREGTAKE